MLIYQRGKCKIFSVFVHKKWPWEKTASYLPRVFLMLHFKKRGSNWSTLPQESNSIAWRALKTCFLEWLMDKKTMAPPDQKTPRAPTVNLVVLSNIFLFLPRNFWEMESNLTVAYFSDVVVKKLPTQKTFVKICHFFLLFFLPTRPIGLDWNCLFSIHRGWSQCRCTSKWPCRWWNRLLQICRKQFRNQIVCRWQCFYLFFLLFAWFRKGSETSTSPTKTRKHPRICLP